MRFADRVKGRSAFIVAFVNAVILSVPCTPLVSKEEILREFPKVEKNSGKQSQFCSLGLKRKLWRVTSRFPLVNCTSLSMLALLLPPASAFCPPFPGAPFLSLSTRRSDCHASECPQILAHVQI